MNIAMRTAGNLVPPVFLVLMQLGQLIKWLMIMIMITLPS